MAWNLAMVNVRRQKQDLTLSKYSKQVHVPKALCLHQEKNDEPQQ